MKDVPKVDAKTFVTDVQAGLGWDILKKRYGLSRIQLRCAVRKLLEIRALTDEDVKALGPMPKRPSSQEFVQDIKSLLVRHQLTIREFTAAIKYAIDTDQISDHERYDVTVNVNKRKKFRVNAKEFAGDVQLGMDRTNLMIKYQITDKQLDLVMKKLVDSKLLSEADVYNSNVVLDTQLLDAVGAAQAAIDEIE